MSICAGKIYCAMYREKKYCKRAPEKENLNKECVCRHARRLCEVEQCSFEDECKKWRSGNAPGMIGKTGLSERGEIGFGSSGQ